MKIYIVHGSTGEYSDRKEWIVCAYKEEDHARKHVLAASSTARELIIKYGNYYNIPRGANPFDPEMSVDCTGVNYDVLPTELLSKMKQEAQS